MYGKVCGFVMGAVLGFVGLCASAFAQAGQQIAIEPSNIDWTSVPSQVITALTTPVIVGIGIALSIWVIMAGVRFFRRSAT